MATEDALADLLLAVGRGDRQAFRAVYEHSSARLFGIVLRIVRDRAVAGEVLQEIYLRVWHRASSFSPQAGRPMTWLIALARHAAIDTVRQRQVATVPLERADGAEAASVPGPGEPGHDVLLHDRLAGCLEELADVPRQCVVLAYTEGYSREELSERFGAPVPTIKTWLRRALLTLRACLGPP